MFTISKTREIRWVIGSWPRWVYQEGHTFLSMVDLRSMKPMFVLNVASSVYWFSCNRILLLLFEFEVALCVYWLCCECILAVLLLRKWIRSTVEDWVTCSWFPILYLSVCHCLRFIYESIRMDKVIKICVLQMISKTFLMSEPASRRSGLHHLFLFWRVDNILHGRTILHRQIHNGWWSILHIVNVFLFYLWHCYKLIILGNTSNEVLIKRRFTACFSTLDCFVLVEYVLTVYFVEFLGCHHLFELGLVSTNSSGFLPCIRCISRNELIFDVSICFHHG